MKTGYNNASGQMTFFARDVYLLLPLIPVVSFCFLPLRPAFKSDPTLNTRAPRRKNFPVFLAEELLTFSTWSQRLVSRVSFVPHLTTNPGTSARTSRGKITPAVMDGRKVPYR